MSEQQPTSPPPAAAPLSPQPGEPSAAPATVAVAQAVAAQQPADNAGPATIQYDDFAKIQLRVATVLKAEAVERSKKLLRLQLDLGTEQRQILAGIKEHYAPDELVGRQIVVVANLAPREVIKGEVSNGMLLAATDAATGKVIVLGPSAPVGPGSGIR